MVNNFYLSTWQSRKILTLLEYADKTAQWRQGHETGQAQLSGILGDSNALMAADNGGAKRLCDVRSQVRESCERCFTKEKQKSYIC